MPAGETEALPAPLDPHTLTLETRAWLARNKKDSLRDNTLKAIVVSHRLSAVADADRILVLKEGCVVEYGSHADLIARDGWYAAQWRYQQLEASLEEA